MTYMSVERPTIQKAFTLAHHLACDPSIHDRERKYFRAIAHEIWKACGEQKTMPENLPIDAREAGRRAYEEVTRDV